MAKSKSLLPEGWNPKEAGDRVLASLKNICRTAVKGAHDSDFIVVDGKAYVVYMANELRPGEHPGWPFVYNALSVVDAESGRVEKTETFASSGRAYANERLPEGACFVPRIIRKRDGRFRIFFASENPGVRESQVWRLDYDPVTGVFDPSLFRVELETPDGLLPMQPQHLYDAAVARGFDKPRMLHGLYMIDSFKSFDGRLYAVLNNFPIGQNAWAAVSDDLTRFRVLGHLILPREAKLTESAVNRLPDGSWLAISRREDGDHRYLFSRSRDGVSWTPHEPWDLVPNGDSSKPTFERFGGVYHLGWQDAARVNGVFRSVFNIAVSRDGKNWELKYRFESEKSFQYPTFREWNGAVYLTVTQGDYATDRKERIMFGRLE